MATELVDMSKKAVSGFMPSMRPFGPSATASTSAGTGREVNTTSLASATWRGELAQTAPLPIMPSPIKPTRISILPRLRPTPKDRECGRADRLSASLAGAFRALFDELVARRADRCRTGRAAITVEGRIAAEFQRVGDELGACRPTRRAARVSDVLVGEVDGPDDGLCIPTGERVGSAGRRVPVLKKRQSRGRPAG